MYVSPRKSYWQYASLQAMGRSLIPTMSNRYVHGFPNNSYKGNIIRRYYYSNIATHSESMVIDSTFGDSMFGGQSSFSTVVG